MLTVLGEGLGPAVHHSQRSRAPELLDLADMLISIKMFGSDEAVKKVATEATTMCFMVGCMRI